MRFLILFSLIALSTAADLDTYKEYLVFAGKNHYKTVSEYAKAVGVTDLDSQWEQFKLKYDRKYSSEEEEERKFHFLKSIQYIESHKKLYESGDVSHTVDINQFADWTPEEYDSMRGTTELPMNMTKALNIDIAELEPSLYANIPDSFDWRQQGKVTAIKNQGSCGCCWAFACAATIESAYAIRHNQFVSLSEQQLLDCTASTNTCAGGYVYKAFEYARSAGLEQSGVYPYRMAKQSCANSASASHVRLSGYSRLPYPASDDTIKAAIMNHGPLSVNICSAGNDFRLYRGGIITGGPSQIDHSVAVVGWGPGYWIIKNQWGTTWGEAGYGKIASGRNVRSFNVELYYPTL
jgi:KDEL-tailed cysteine endopeptidase